MKDEEGRLVLEAGPIRAGRVRLFDTLITPKSAKLDPTTVGDLKQWTTFAVLGG